jgi:ATP-dependent Clp protease protease subunit
MTGKISIFGEIGTDVTVQDIQKQIQANAMAENLEVQISSPGGDVFDGYTIYNLLKNTGKEINTVVVGLCASIATLIAAAGKKIVMNKTSQFMIHNPEVSGLSGDAGDLRGTADQLDKIKNLLINVYQQKTGLTKEKLWEMYDNETWLTAEEANGFKFVDDVQDTIRAVAKIDPSKFKSMDTKEKDTFLQRIENKFKAIWNIVKYKNMFTETMEDGKTIQVMSEDENWTGKPLTYDDGSPVPPGSYKLASGKSITVDENSTITEVTAGEAEAPEQTENNDMQAKEIEDLKAKLKTAEEALAATKTENATAQAKAKTFEAKVKDLEKDLNEIKTTFGDTKPPKDGFKQFMSHEEGGEYDPMGEDYKRHLQSREII